MRGARALTVGLLALLLVVAGALPAAAGGPGPSSPGPGGRNAAEVKGGRHEPGRSATQVGGGSAPAPRRIQGSAPRPAPRRATGPRAAGSHAAAPAKPAPAARAKAADRNRKPQVDAPAPERALEEAPQPLRLPSSPGRPTATVRSSTAEVRRVAAVRPSAAAPSAQLFGPLAAPVPVATVATVDLEAREPWPRLPGALGHPAFPGLLVALLLGFVALGCRGDWRDPKLAAAAIDDRDDRAQFR